MLFIYDKINIHCQHLFVAYYVTRLHSFKCLTSSLDPHENTYKEGASIFCILLIRKLNSRGPLSCKWSNWDLNTGSLTSRLCYIKRHSCALSFNDHNSRK